ncbi:MAG TPA: hypothetical protein DC057_01570 [Spirochaetia bacterium]|nr:hypothetical protein [Spirochaetia bacterium]
MSNKTKKIFITGSAGLIGSSFYVDLKKKGFLVYGIDCLESSTIDSILDISNRKNLKVKLHEINPDIIIHVAAIKGLCDCENNRLRAWDVNVGSTAEIVQYAHINNTKIIYISSDVVFDGKLGDYKETDLPNPINWYGTIKYHSELLVNEVTNSAICRTALVVGKLREKDKDQLNIELKSKTLDNQSLLPYFIIGKLKQKERLNLSSETVSSPTDVDLLVLAVAKIIDKDFSGIFHCTGSESISRFDFALRIAEKFNLDKLLIQKDLSSDLSIRPKNLNMNIKDTYSKLELIPSDWDIEKLIIKISNNI